MTRVEELTSLLVDEALSPVEAAELERMLDEDPEARRVHVRLVEVEKTLRGRRPAPDVSPTVMNAIRGSQREARIVRGVMTHIKRPGVTRPSRARSWAAPLALAAGFLLVAGVVGARLVRRHGSGTAANVPAVGAVATVAAARGPVTRVRGGERRPASAGLALVDGDVLEVGDRGEATLALADGTRVSLGAATALAMSDVDAGPIRRLGLSRGTLTAEVAPQPADGALVFETPHARATVLGTRLSLLVTEAQTQLEVANGRVLFERLLEAGSLEVGAGGSAVATSGAVAARKPEPAARLTRPASPTADTLLAVDFQSGTLPPFFYEGQIVSDGCRPGRRFCVIGTVKAGELARVSTVVMVRPRPELFAYADTAVVAFDYWAGSDARELAVQVWDPDRRQNYSIHLLNMVREQWAHAELRLSEARPHLYPNRPMEEGDRIENVYIFSGRTGGKPFYIDDLRVIDYPPGQEPKRSTTRAINP